MSNEQITPTIAPDRTQVIPETYAVYVDDELIHVWQYRVRMSEPDGEWDYLETLAREEEPRLTLEYAIPMPADSEGYWIYSQSYDCELDCE